MFLRRAASRFAQGVARPSILRYIHFETKCFQFTCSNEVWTCFLPQMLCLITKRHVKDGDGAARASPMQRCQGWRRASPGTLH